MVAVLIVDGLETVNVHVGRDEGISRAVGTVNLALQVLESNAPSARAGQLVGPGLLAVKPGCLAITLSELAVDGGQRPVMFGALATERCLLETLYVVRAPHHRPSIQQPVGAFKLKCCRVVGLCLLVTSGGELVALLGRPVAMACALVVAMRDQ